MLDHQEASIKASTLPWRHRLQERYALDLCRKQGGRVLDLGAGVGCSAEASGPQLSCCSEAPLTLG